MSQRANIISLHTCGRAFGAVGAFVCAPQVLGEFPINRGRAFIFATAPSPLIAAITRAVLILWERSDGRRTQLQQLVDCATRALDEHCGLKAFGSHIVPVIVGKDE